MLVSRARKTRRGEILTEPCRAELSRADPGFSSRVEFDGSRSGKCRLDQVVEASGTYTLRATTLSTRTASNFAPGKIDKAVILLRFNFPRVIEARDACSIRACFKNAA